MTLSGDNGPPDSRGNRVIEKNGSSLVGLCLNETRYKLLRTRRIGEVGVIPGLFTLNRPLRGP